jgi:hypothetical protein
LKAQRAKQARRNHEIARAVMARRDAHMAEISVERAHWMHQLCPIPTEC